MRPIAQEFRTTLKNFTGPLDLLLYLIKKNEIDLLNIPVAEVLEQYEQYVKLLEELDVNAASDYLVMATKLMEIKSRMLLPVQQEDDDDEELEDPRSDLVQQLLEYRTYKERALNLEERLAENTRRFVRREPHLPFPLKRIEIAKLSVWDLVTSFMHIQEEIAAKGPTEIVYTEKPISYYVTLIQGTFKGKQSDCVPFRDIFFQQEQLDRNLMVGLFLAVLELVKIGGIGLKRGETPQEILITRLNDDLSDFFRSLSTQHQEREEESGEGAQTEAALQEEESGEDAD